MKNGHQAPFLFPLFLRHHHLDDQRNLFAHQVKGARGRKLKIYAPVRKRKFAAQVKLREEGNIAASKVIKEVTTSPSRGMKYVEAYESQKDQNRRQMCPQKALGLNVDADLLRRQYNIVRESDKSLL